MPVEFVRYLKPRRTNIFRFNCVFIRRWKIFLGNIKSAATGCGSPVSRIYSDWENKLETTNAFITFIARPEVITATKFQFMSITRELRQNIFHRYSYVHARKPDRNYSTLDSAVLGKNLIFQRGANEINIGPNGIHGSKKMCQLFG